MASGSYRKIDYRMRPAKAVERRMMTEYFFRLRALGSVEDYRYVGMGSVYFSDFALFHMSCGFKEMISIEDTQDPVIQKRFHLNAPLGSIDMKFGSSNVELPKLSWDKKSAIWMDYDGVLDADVLTDLTFLASAVSAESTVWVSVNGELRDDNNGVLSKLAILTSRVGQHRIPPALQQQNNLSAAEVPAAFREILNNEIVAALVKRNAGIQDPNQHMCAEQVAFFKYSDAAIMLTLGWVFFKEGDRERFNACQFSMLSHSRAGADPFTIEIPFITNAEIRELNRCKYVGNKLQLNNLPLPTSEVNKYLALKRFWPVLQIPEMT